MPLLNSVLQAEILSPLGEHDSQQEESLIYYARQHSKFNVPELSVKIGQLSVCLYVPFMAACSVLLPHMCFFIGCCKLENIINSVGFRDSLKMISI